MDPQKYEFIQKIFLAQLHFPETDDSDSDFDPDEYESSTAIQTMTSRTVRRSLKRTCTYIDELPAPTLATS